MTLRRYQPTGAGYLAIDPRAFGALFEVFEAPPVEMRDGVAIVAVRGPLTHHAGLFGDSYDGIRARVAGALEVSPRALVLAIDSPGGDVGGCFELATEIRDRCAAQGVQLVAYVDGKAASAAYALACVASKIVAPATSFVGSIGTVCELLDVSKVDAAMGVHVEVIASGERKLDGNPHVPLTDAARAAARGHIASLAEHFFAHVAAHRAVGVETARALNGALVLGDDAVRIGLVDELGSLSTLLSQLASPTTAAPAATGSASRNEGQMDEEELRAALRARAEDENVDEQARARARAALKALDDEREPDANDEPAPDGRAQDPAALAQRAIAMIEQDRRERAVAELVASRPDISPEQRAFARTLEPAACERFLATIKPAPRRNPAAAMQPGVLPADTRPPAGDPSNVRRPEFRQAPEAVDRMRAAMGLSAPKRGVIDNGRDLVLGGVVKD